MSRILVIDDEPGSRLIVQSRLKDVGFRVESAETGAKGLEAARAVVFDVFLVAAGLESGIDGLEVCRRLKGMPETQDIPTIVYCNRPVSSEELTRGYEAGADAYVSKTEMAVLDHLVRVKLREKSRLDDLAEQNRTLEEHSRRLIEEQQQHADTETASKDAGEQALVFRELAAGRPDGILMVDAEGHVRSADRGACELLGNRLEGHNLGSLAPATGLEAFVRDARTEAREGFRFDVTGRSGRAPRSLTAAVVPLVSSPGDSAPALRVVLLLDAGKRRIAAEMMRIAEPGIPRQQLHSLVEAAREAFTPDRLLGGSEVITKAREAIVACGQHRLSVMLRGAPGTGKARAAATIHYSSQATGPYFSLRCNSLEPDELARELFGCGKTSSGGGSLERPGLLHQAKAGSVYLEDVDQLSKDAQERVLRLLVEGKVRRENGRRDERCDVRILSSVSCDWAEAKKRMLPELVDKLTDRSIELTPLNERPEDIQAIVRGLLVLYGGTKGVSELPDEVLYVLENHDWSKNVDELVAHIESACARADGTAITIKSLPRVLADLHATLNAQELIPQSRREGTPVRGTHVVHRGSSLGSVGQMARPQADWDITDEDPIDLELYEKKALLRALDFVKGDKLAAARLLHVGKSTLYRKLKKLGIA